MIQDITPDFVLQGLIWFVALIASITVHEAAHAWMAWRCGDGTAKYQGRLTLDPLAHMDPIGTVLMPILMYFTSFQLLGWARPVPVYIYNLRYPSRDFMLVALAGPISNLIQAVIWLILFKIYLAFFRAETAHMLSAWIGRQPLVEPGIGVPEALLLCLGLFIFMSIVLNLILAVFNMIPIPPLDGSKVLNHFLPSKGQDLLHSMEPFGFILILMLMWTGILGAALSQILEYVIFFIVWVMRL